MVWEKGKLGMRVPFAFARMFSIMLNHKEILLRLFSAWCKCIRLFTCLYYTTKLIYLNSIGYLNLWETIDKIFLIKKTDDEGQTFETIV